MASPQPQSLDNHHVQDISSLLRRVEALESILNLETRQSLRHAAARVIQIRFRSFLVRRSGMLRNLLKGFDSVKPSVSSSQPHFNVSAPSLELGLDPPGVHSSAPLNLNTDPATCATSISIPPSNGSKHCEVCKIDCSSKEHLDQHLFGKKHKKNLEKLTQAHTSGSSSLVTGPEEQNGEGKTINGLKSKRKIETPEVLENKKKKVLENGTTADAVRTCAICNVVCTSEKVYSDHVAGKMHVKKASDLGQGKAS